jgi:glycosyltransferase involved in cell wall biosynthesis
MRICYFGLYNPEYARNAVIRRGLQLHGAEVTQCQIESGYGADQYRALLAKIKSLKMRPDVIIVAEHNQFVVPLAWAWARQCGARLVFDPFTSLYDSDVLDRRVVAPHSLTALRRFWLDKVSMCLADHVLADTDQHRQYYAATFGLNLDTVHVVPIGADDVLFAPRAQQEGPADLGVLFWGTYIPLHGVDIVLRAAHLLQSHREIAIELIGSGQTYGAMRHLATELNLPATMFLPRISPAEVPAAVAKADLCLGIFGQTAKARRVVPNKVYEALAMHKPVITGDSPALREFFIPGRHLWAVPMADSAALAEGILGLANNPAMREQLAEAGYQRYLAEFTPQAIGGRVMAMLKQITGNGARA